MRSQRQEKRPCAPLWVWILLISLAVVGLAFGILALCGVFSGVKKNPTVGNKHESVYLQDAKGECPRCPSKPGKGILQGWQPPSYEQCCNAVRADGEEQLKLPAVYDRLTGRKRSNLSGRRRGVIGWRGRGVLTAIPMVRLSRNTKPKYEVNFTEVNLGLRCGCRLQTRT